MQTPPPFNEHVCDIDITHGSCTPAAPAAGAGTLAKEHEDYTGVRSGSGAKSAPQQLFTEMQAIVQQYETLVNTAAELRGVPDGVQRKRDSLHADWIVAKQACRASMKANTACGVSEDDVKRLQAEFRALDTLYKSFNPTRTSARERGGATSRSDTCTHVREGLAVGPPLLSEAFTQPTGSTVEVDRMARQQRLLQRPDRYTLVATSTGRGRHGSERQVGLQMQLCVHVVKVREFNTHVRQRRFHESREVRNECAHPPCQAGLRVVSLFDGCSTARVALAAMLQARGRTDVHVEYWFSEICPYALAVTQTRWPDALPLGDVRHVQWPPPQQPAHLCVDLLVGGSPCTDLTQAGLRAGLAGAESRLFWEYVRVREACAPRFWLFENVASMMPEAEAAITRALGCEPVAVNAACFGPSVRRRKFWTNLPGVTAAAAQALAPAAACIADVLLPPSARLDAVFLDPARIAWVPGPPRVSFLGVRTVGHRVHGDGRDRGDGSGHHRDRDRQRPRRRQSVLGTHTQVFASDAKLSAMTHSCTHMPVQLPDGRVRTLDTRELERCQGLPTGYTEVLKDGVRLSRSRRAALVGLSFHAGVVEWLLSHLPLPAVHA